MTGVTESIISGVEESMEHASDEVCLLIARLNAVEAEYHELLLAVVCKHENETRHETALRYIQEKENPKYDEKKSASHTTGG